MPSKHILAGSTLARYIYAIRSSPRELIANRHLLATAALYACAGIPLAWDQGTSPTVPSLPGFASDFRITSGTNAKQISNFTSLVYIGCGVGAATSFFINDRIGRLWSFRLYTFAWIVGQMIATGSSGHIAVLYVARIVSGLGIGALTVTGPVSLVEIAPYEIRGLIAVWFSVAMLLALFVAAFCTYGVFLHVAAGPLQYQIVFFAPCIFLALVDEEATKNLVALRGLHLGHARVMEELQEITDQRAKDRIHGVGSTSWEGFKRTCHETFTVKANLRRTQQALISYALAQLSGANSVTSYLVPILRIVGAANDDTAHSLFLSGMYSFAKFCFTLMASFFFIDALGRRRSLFIGITIQMISDTYVGVFIRFKELGNVSDSAGQAAIAMIFLHGFGYAVGLLILPYVFGAEVWPNHLRSFGSAMAQTFHWLFFFGVNKGVPSLLARTDNWGAFLFFAGWCFLALLYVFLVVPETAGLSLEQTDALFKGPWLIAYQSKSTLHGQPTVLEGLEPSDTDTPEKPDKNFVFPKQEPA